MAYFPFMIEIADKNCLVVGGGTIAFHKVKLLLDFDVSIKVVGTEICKELRELERETNENAGMNPVGKQQKECEIMERAFCDSDIENMDFVIAATDDERLNHHISNLCRQRNILVNAVDQKEACDFIFPAMIQDKDLLIAVSTGGQSPAAAAYVKRQIKGHIPDYYGDMVEKLGEYRDDILEHVSTAKKRKEIFNKLLEYGDTHDGEIPKNIVEHIVADAEE